MENFKIISECYLCKKNELQVLNNSTTDTYMQCINCGYSSSTPLEGNMNENEYFNKLDDDIKSWSLESNGFIWTPSVVNLKTGTIYPIDVDGNMKWAFAELVEIDLEKMNETEKMKYKKNDGSFFDKKFDIENQLIFDKFNEAVFKAEEIFKENGRK